MDGAVAESLMPDPSEYLRMTVTGNCNNSLTLNSGAAGRAFDLATAADVPEIRRLLRDNPMEGAIRLSLEPAPHANPLDAPGATVYQTLVGRRADGSLFGLGTRTVRPAYINGKITPLGYLGSLRLDIDHRRNPRALLRGYDKLRELHEADGACQLYLTSIMADNVPARRFLEANLRGMPTYRLVGDFVSLVMSVRRRTEMCDTMRPGSPDRMAEVASLLERCGRRMQFAPVWNRDAKLPCGLAASNFRLAINSAGSTVACAALWDLRFAKQTVVRGYAPQLARWKWGINLVSGIMGRSKLPEVGQSLKLAYASFLAAADEVSPAAMVGLVEGLHALAGTRDIEYLVAGFPAADPWLAALRKRFGGREIHSRLYVVHWPDGQAAADALDGRPLGPEVAPLVSTQL